MSLADRDAGRSVAGGAGDRHVTPSPEPVAPGRLHEALDRPDDQPVRRRDHAARRAAAGHPDPRRRARSRSGILGVVRFLPWILFTLPAGVWVDRMRRRPILIGADIARAVLLASIPIAFLGGWLTHHPGLRRRLPRRHARGLLRRRLPVVPAEHRRARRAGRGQLEARALARRVVGRRPDRRRLPDPGSSGRRSPSPSMR